MATILLGTLYPLILDVLGVAKISVGPPYFNKVFIPLMTLLLIAMGIGPLCRWQSMPGKMLLSKMQGIAIIALISAVLLPLFLAHQVTLSVVLGLSLAGWVLLAIVKELLPAVKRYNGKLNLNGWMSLKRNQYGMCIAHMGIAVTVIGVTLLSAYHVERDVRMSLMETITVGPYQFQFTQINPLQGPNYSGLTGIFQVSESGKIISTLRAEKRIFTVSKNVMTRAAIEPGVWRDLYVALGEALPDGAWGVRIYYKPFVRWIWAGGLLMMLGGLLAASDRRYRKYA
jgi:cytochrome c-type biogenesis protein CcmF